MEQLEFKNPEFLFLLVPFSLMVIWYLYGRLYRKEPAIPVSSESVIVKRSSFRTATYRYLPILRFVSIFLLIISLSRPGRGINYSTVKNLGIDIIIALDVSGSMMGEDFQPDNRLTVAKKVINSFIDKRKNDRIGMVVFAGDAYLQSPLTIEHDMIKDIVNEIDFNTVPLEGTAIGDAIALSASRLMDRKSKSKIILLITDGMNNRGVIEPETAAHTCAEMGIKIYSVGIGKDGEVPYPNPGGLFFGKRRVINQFDPTTLEKASKITKGKFYRAVSSGIFWENIKEIDMLEKSEVDIKIYHEFYDKFFIFLYSGIFLFFFEILLRSVFYRKVP